MIEIRQLSELSPQDARRLIYGYTSQMKYAVRKVERIEFTQITLELTHCNPPYARRWEPSPEDLARYQGYLHEGLSVAAYDQQEMVGLAITEPRRWNKTLWIWEIHVAETHQRRGIGKQMIESLAHKAQAAGLLSLGVETQNTNFPAITFYRRVGFAMDGIDLSFYAHTDAPEGEVAIFMKRKLHQSP